MSTITSTAANNAVRSEMLAALMECRAAKGDEVLVTGSGSFVVPMVNALGDEIFVKVSVSVPKGTKDGDAYDGYTDAQMYAEKVQAAADKKAAKEKEKQRRPQSVPRKRRQRKRRRNPKGSKIPFFFYN